MRRKKQQGDGYKYYQYIGMDGKLHDFDNEQPAIPIPEPEKPKPKKKTFKQMFTYSYKGPVKVWKDIRISNFEAVTSAVSERKAEQNIIFRAKKQLGLAPNAGGVRLVNKIQLER